MRSDELRKPAYTSGPWRIGYGGMDGDTTATITSAFAEYPICQLEPLGYVQANARLIAAAPRMFQALERVNDSVQEPDKWAQDVRFALQDADGVERRPQSAEARRRELQVQRAAPELLAQLRDAHTLLLALRTKVSDADAPLINNWIADARAAIAKAEGKV
jgi:hypothetical protein